VSVSIAALEEATIRAWPARQTETRFGWRLLCSGGVTGRVNACWPLDWTGETSVDDAIDAAERWYAARGLPPRFKLTASAIAPDTLPEALARRGYTPSADTLIMTRPLDNADRDAAGGLRLDAALSRAFIDALRAMSAHAAEFDERAAIAQRAPQPAAFALIGDAAGAARAIGMSACAGELAGIFLMRTAEDARRQGHAQAILAALLAWAKAAGAAHAFLQVEASNHGAIALYRRAGFSEASRYAFWRPSSPA
jgi:ribosomal protein S18 acetylase RimI-like enzyme